MSLSAETLRCIHLDFAFYRRRKCRKLKIVSANYSLMGFRSTHEVSVRPSPLYDLDSANLPRAL
jgi:hypothetical protein